MHKKLLLRAALVALFLFLILSTFQAPEASQKASVQEILSNPDKYDGQEVSVQGQASKIRPRTSKRGNDYTTLTISDSGKVLNVFTWGHPMIKDGQKITVTDIFQKVKRVGRYTFYNEVEAKDIK